MAVGLIGGAVWMLDAKSTEAAKGPENEAGEVLATDEADPDEGPRSGGGGSPVARIKKLEREVESLKRDVRLLRAAKGLAVRARSGASDNGASDNGASGGEPFEGAVRDIIEDDRKEEREAELERRRDSFAQFADETAKELAKEAGLGDEARDSVAQLWRTEVDAVLPLMMAARSGERSFPEVREEVEKVRSETDAAAKALMNEKQFETYEELRPRGRRRGGRRGRN